jgi:hypothetical protein
LWHLLLTNKLEFRRGERVHVRCGCDQDAIPCGDPFQPLDMPGPSTLLLQRIWSCGSGAGTRFTNSLPSNVLPSSKGHRNMASNVRGLGGSIRSVVVSQGQHLMPFWDEISPTSEPPSSLCEATPGEDTCPAPPTAKFPGIGHLFADI